MRVVVAILAIAFSASTVAVFLFFPERSNQPIANPGAGHGPPDIVAESPIIEPTTGIKFEQFKLQGITVLIPQDGGKNWLSNLNYDGCDPLRAQYFVIEHRPSGVRFRVDLRDREIRFKGLASPEVKKVTDIIEASFEGKFEGDPRLEGTPRPIPLDCVQPQEDVPPVYEPFEPPPRAVEPPDATPQPSATPQVMPTPVFQR